MIGWKRYRKYTGEIVDAYKVTTPRAIPTPMGLETAFPGSYVVLNAEGKLWVERKDCFEEYYGATNGPESWTGSGL